MSKTDGLSDLFEQLTIFLKEIFTAIKSLIEQFKPENKEEEDTTE